MQTQTINLSAHGPDPHRFLRKRPTTRAAARASLPTPNNVNQQNRLAAISGSCDVLPGPDRRTLNGHSEGLT